MSEMSFKESIFEVASKLKGSALNDYEKSKIIEHFNASGKATSAEKAREAMEKVIQRRLPVLQFKESASLDNIDMLLRQMEKEAEQWDNQ